METEERSNRDHPVKDDGDYETLASIAVYEIDDAGKVRGIHVYDQHPLRIPDSPSQSNNEETAAQRGRRE